MKTWEMIKQLTENPEKEFQLVGEDGTVVFIDYSYEERKINLNCVDYMTIDDNWEEVKEPVDFITAFESGKRVSVKCAIETFEGRGKLREIYYRKPNEMLRTLAGYGDEIAIDIIVNGDWYIE